MYCDVVDFVHRCASSECQEGYLPDVMGYEGGDRAAGRLHSSVCLFVCCCCCCCFCCCFGRCLIFALLSNPFSPPCLSSCVLSLLCFHYFRSTIVFYGQSTPVPPDKNPRPRIGSTLRTNSVRYPTSPWAIWSPS